MLVTTPAAQRAKSAAIALVEAFFMRDEYEHPCIAKRNPHMATLRPPADAQGFPRSHLQQKGAASPVIASFNMVFGRQLLPFGFLSMDCTVKPSPASQAAADTRVIEVADKRNDRSKRADAAAVLDPLRDAPSRILLATNRPLGRLAQLILSREDPHKGSRFGHPSYSARTLSPQQLRAGSVAELDQDHDPENYCRRHRTTSLPTHPVDSGT